MDCSPWSLKELDTTEHLSLTSLESGKMLLSERTVIMSVLVSQSCPTLFNPVDCRPPGSSVHGILQRGILEWVAIAFSRGSSRLREGTTVSCIAGGFFTV